MPLLPLLWLGDPTLLERSQAAVLERWSSRQGLEVARVESPGPARRHDAAVADEIEALLAEARQVHSAVGRGRQVFETIDAILNAHPELPQAGWLYAERLALEARTLTMSARERGGEPEAAAAALSARARAVSESRARTLEQPADDPAAAQTAPGVRLEPILRPSDSLLIDGKLWSPGSEWTAGRHHLMLYRQGVRVVARFAELDASGGDVIGDPTEACSALDLLGVLAERHRPVPPAGVLCPDWVVARPGAFGGVELARCARDGCQPWQLLDPPIARSAQPSPQTPSAIDASPEPSRAWITWVAVGAGAILATGVVLWRSGAFGSDERRTEYVFTGPTASASWSF